MKGSEPGSSRARMGILYETTALLLVVLLFSGLAMFLILRKSQEQLSE
jgi:preprotein translocase subunit YajC